jgi:hypothetical protein
MKQLIGIACIAMLAAVALAVSYEDAPAYVTDQYYVFTDATVATNALNAINGSGWFPITGNNAETGEPEPGKAKTTKWADEVRATADGKYVFPRIPTAIMDAQNVPEAERKAWWDAFTPDVESYNEAWFPPEE